MTHYKKYISLLITVLSISPLIAQVPDVHPFNKDSTLYHDIKLITKISDLKNYDGGFVMIYISKDLQAKGFISSNDDEFSYDKDSTFHSDICNSEDRDVRFIIHEGSDSTMHIQYKWKSSVEFVSDTFYVFQCDWFLMAYPINLFENNIETVVNSARSWYPGPASSDQREVVKFCKSENTIELFY